MSTKTTLQVPMDKKLKASALAAAKAEGFSSLQEAVRVLLHKLAQKQITINFTDEKFPPEYLTPEQEAILEKKRKTLEAEIEAGTAFTYDPDKQGDFFEQHRQQINDRKIQ